MPVIALVGKKGGIGKTTTAVSLAVLWHEQGFRVVLVDGDHDDLDGSALEWSAVAHERDIPAPPVVPLAGKPNQAVIAERLRSLAASFDVVIVDTPGALHERTVYALGETDLAIMPCGPAGFEVWRMPKVLAQVRAVQKLRKGLDAAILVTRKQPGTVLGRNARAELRALGCDILKTELFYRLDYGESTTDGRGPTNYGNETKAGEEIVALGREVAKRVGLTKAAGERTGYSRRRGT